MCIAAKLRAVRLSRIPPRVGRAVALGCVVLALGPARPLAGQPVHSAAVATPGSAVERARRLQGLLDANSALDPMARGTAAGIAELARRASAIYLLQPEIAASYHSAHPWGGNDGPLRAGRGRNLLASAGLAGRWGPVTAMILPQYAEEANLEFQVRQYPQPIENPPRNLWANPFYAPGNTADFPQRFGDQSRSTVEAQWRVAVEPGFGLRLGVGRETRWWGPGLNNALLISGNAPAIDQLFVEAAAPLKTPIGRLSYTYMLGRLEESEFFDFNAANDTRSLSAATLHWTPSERFELLPILSVSRAVMARRSPGWATALDFGRNVGRAWSRPADTSSGREQITTIAALWRVPEAGIEAWAEWARLQFPGSLREFMEQPGHSQGYTLGFQWAKPTARGSLFHLATEWTYLEPDPSIRTRPVKTSYVGTAVEHGWTHRGQMLGPWIGPAASTQWIMGDWYVGAWRFGGNLGRLRRDANFRFIEPLPLKREDTQMWAGLRLGRTLWGFDVLLDYTDAVRLNHLFQAYWVPGTTDDFNFTTGVDLINRSLALTIAPHLPLRR